MGWSGVPCRKPANARELADAALEEFLSGWKTPPRVLAHKASKGVLYAKMETVKDDTKVRWIAVVLYSWEDGELLLKTMDNSMGPNYYDVPVKWLDDVPVANEFDAGWRCAILEKAKRRKDAGKLKEGDVVAFDVEYAGSDTWVYSGANGVFTCPDTGRKGKLRAWKRHFVGVKEPKTET